MHVNKLRLAALLATFGSICGHADYIAIGSFSDGIITWANTLSSAVYQIEWASSLSSGNWTNTWSCQQNLASTNPTLQVAVPLYYRVSGISYIDETNSSVCYSIYSNALLDAKAALPHEVSNKIGRASCRESV